MESSWPRTNPVCIWFPILPFGRLKSSLGLNGLRQWHFSLPIEWVNDLQLSSWFWLFYGLASLWSLLLINQFKPKLRFRFLNSQIFKRLWRGKSNNHPKQQQSENLQPSESPDPLLWNSRYKMVFETLLMLALPCQSISGITFCSCEALQRVILC